MAYGVSNSSKSSNFRKASLEVEAGGFSGNCLVPMGNGQWASQLVHTSTRKPRSKNDVQDRK
jgi:hypothetical protein